MDFLPVAVGICGIISFAAGAVATYVALKLRPLEEKLEALGNYDRWRGGVDAKLDSIEEKIDRLMIERYNPKASHGT